MQKQTQSRLSATLAAVLLGAAPGLAIAEYSFKVDGNGTAIKIWWTDSRGNRIGDPIYEGTLQVGEVVRRSTTSADVYDHSLKEENAFSVGFNDVHWGGSVLADVQLDKPVSLPTLLDVDPVGGIVHVFYIIDASVFAANGGQFQPGRIYANFNPNGTHPDLPGYIVGWSNNPKMTIEEAFQMDFATGHVLFRGAQPFHPAMGSLLTSLRMTAEPTPCRADFDGDGFVTGIDYDLYVAAFEAGLDSADFDGDGFITGIDFDMYVAAFEAGCA